MKHLIVLAMLIVGILGAACQPRTESGNVPGAASMEWSIIQSPNTGRCYEVVTWTRIGFKGYGYAGLAQVPCPPNLGALD